jgi:hypothetical protein
MLSILIDLLNVNFLASVHCFCSRYHIFVLIVVLLLLSVSGDQSDGECKPGLCIGEACVDRLNEMIQAISIRVGTAGHLNDTNSAQSKALAWMVQQCYAVPSIDPCNASLITLTEQRYALAVMYFSLGGDGWEYGANPDLDPNAPPGQWMSYLNHCEWSTEIVEQDWRLYNQLVCDEFGNVLNLNFSELIFIHIDIIHILVKITSDII